MASFFGSIEARYAASRKLLALSVDLTWRCNLKCRHCYLSQKSSSARASRLDVDIALRLLEDAVKLGAVSLLLSGGEPLLHPDFWQVLDRAKDLNLFTSVFTHAGLIDETCARELRNLSVLDIGVSLYSHIAVVHDRVTGVGGSFEKTMRGIRALLSQGIHVTIKTPVLAGYNDQTLEPFMDWVEALGPRVRHSLSPDITPRDDGDWNAFRYKPDLTQSLRVLELLGRRDQKVVQTSRFNPALRDKRLVSFPCKAGISRLHVRADAMVVPCMELIHPLGDLRKERLPGIWERIKAPDGMAFMPRLGDIKGCAACEHIDRCSPCVGLGLKQQGDVTDPPITSCYSTYARLLLEDPACLPPKPLQRDSIHPSGFVCGSSFCMRNCTD